MQWTGVKRDRVQQTLSRRWNGFGTSAVKRMLTERCGSAYAAYQLGDETS
jgi:hypothetical protein